MCKAHRCHQKEFLLKFRRDRRRWIYWLFEAKKRYGLCVLNYTVTSNHVHLLVKDTGGETIARSMQLIAGRTAQEYNQRKNRKGAYWEDRYHATAVQGDGHLARCLVYIDLNMVRAGVVGHPDEWPESGYQEIQSPSQRYRIVDLDSLQSLFGLSSLARRHALHRAWVDAALKVAAHQREAIWSDSIAVGSLEYVEEMKANLGIGARERKVDETAEGFILREPGVAYNHHFEWENVHLNAENMVPWQTF
jgi:putative transposase